MARVKIPFATETKIIVSGSTVIAPVVGAAVSVKNRDTSSAASVFAAETGGSTIASPVTDENGNLPGWLEEGSYTITISGGSPAISPVEQAWDAVRGDGVANVATGAVGTAQLGSEAVTTPKLANASITEPKLANEAVTASKLANGAVTEGKLASGSVTGSKLGSGAAKYEQGLASGRPAAGNAGRIYYATDTTGYSVDTGSAWNAITPIGSGKTYTAAAEGFSGVASATHAAFVVIQVSNASSFFALNVYVGAAKIGRLSAPSGSLSLGFLLPPGIEWKVAEGEGAFNVLWTALVL